MDSWIVVAGAMAAAGALTTALKAVMESFHTARDTRNRWLRGEGKKRAIQLTMLRAEHELLRAQLMMLEQMSSVQTPEATQESLEKLSNEIAAIRDRLHVATES